MVPCSDLPVWNRRRDAGLIAVIGPPKAGLRAGHCRIGIPVCRCGQDADRTFGCGIRGREPIGKGSSDWRRKKRNRDTRTRIRKRKPCERRRGAGSCSRGTGGKKSRFFPRLPLRNRNWKKKIQELEEQLVQSKKISFCAQQRNTTISESERNGKKQLFIADATAAALAQILPVEDNLERALAQTDCTVQRIFGRAMRDGAGPDRETVLKNWACLRWGLRAKPSIRLFTMQ